LNPFVLNKRLETLSGTMPWMKRWRQTHLNLVYRLKKALYGLKQTPKAWSDKIGEYLVTSGFQTSNADFSLYVKKTDHGIVVIVIYVDDLIIIRDSDVDIFD